MGGDVLLAADPKKAAASSMKLAGPRNVPCQEPTASPLEADKSGKMEGSAGARSRLRTVMSSEGIITPAAVHSD